MGTGFAVVGVVVALLVAAAYGASGGGGGGGAAPGGSSPGGSGGGGTGPTPSLPPSDGANLPSTGTGGSDLPTVPNGTVTPGEPIIGIIVPTTPSPVPELPPTGTPQAPPSGGSGGIVVTATPQPDAYYQVGYNESTAAGVARKVYGPGSTGAQRILINDIIRNAPQNAHFNFSKSGTPLTTPYGAAFFPRWASKAQVQLTGDTSAPGQYYGTVFIPAAAFTVS